MNSWKTKNNRQKAVAAADAAARTVSGTAALVLRILLTVLLTMILMLPVRRFLGFRKPVQEKRPAVRY